MVNVRNEGGADTVESVVAAAVVSRQPLSKLADGLVHFHVHG